MGLRVTGQFKMEIKKARCSRKKELAIGRKIEMEHASLFPKDIQKKMAGKIAGQHIDEFPCYYTQGLIKMEKRLKASRKENSKKLKGGIRKYVR